MAGAGPDQIRIESGSSPVGGGDPPPARGRRAGSAGSVLRLQAHALWLKAQSLRLQAHALWLEAQSLCLQAHALWLDAQSLRL